MPAFAFGFFAGFSSFGLLVLAYLLFRVFQLLRDCLSVLVEEWRDE